MSIDIIGLGVGLPKRVITNEELSTFVDTSDKWIKTRTGIESRRVCEKETLLDLSFMAASEALEHSKLDASDIDLIICATMQGDNLVPNLASGLQEKLSATCPAFDINAACSGFLYALAVAKGFIDSKMYKKVLIVCAEMMSRHIDWTKRETSVLFGDGAAACVVTAGESLKYINLSAKGDDKILHAKLGGGNSPFTKNTEKSFLYMNGQEVYKFAIGAVTEEIEKGLDTLKITAEDIDYFVLHQANKRIIDAIRDSLGLSEDKFPINIQSYGNTSSVSLLLLLHELLKDGKIKKGDKLFLVAFGGGLSSAAGVITWAL